MKTSKILVALMSAAMLLIAGNGFAAITGGCVDCHTMHNSQDGASMRYDSDGMAPAELLLRAGSCQGCHADTTNNGGATGNTLDTALIPQVDAATMAAAGSGGSFNWVATADTVASSATGHNIAILAGIDRSLTSVPGYTDLADAGRGVDSWNPQNLQVTCAGVNGCHGTNAVSEFDAVKTAHHNNDGNDGSAVLAGTAGDIGSGFRFLDGITGIESSEFVPTVTDHNVYAGSTDGTATDTISALCARCHNKFHRRDQAVLTEGIGGSASPWLRHPTDIDMEDVGYDGTEYADYTFDIIAPVAAVNLTGMTSAASTADYANKVVNCLSCHYAHGSDEPDLLRWTYSGMVAGTANTTGCFNCHTAKDGTAGN